MAPCLLPGCPLSAQEASRKHDSALHGPLSYFWVEPGPGEPQAGWVAVDGLGRIVKTAEGLGSRVGVRLANLPFGWRVTRLVGPIESAT